MVDLPIHEISTPEAKSLGNLRSLSNDFTGVEAVLRVMLHSDDSVIQAACFTAGLITYRRCFNSGVRNGLTRDDVLALGRNAFELHDYLIAQANKLAAHSVNPFEETLVGVIVGDNNLHGIATLSAKFQGPDAANIHQWIELVQCLQREALAPRIEEAMENVNTAVKGVPLDVIRKWPIMSYTAPSPDQANKRRE